jgi:hypothetical protein
VGDPRLVFQLMAAAGLAPEADGGGLDGIDGFNQDADAIGKDKFCDRTHALVTHFERKRSQ